MSKTPNPTEGKLTEAEIEHVRAWAHSKTTYVTMDDCINKLCDMALESLKAPSKAVCNECGGSKEVLRKNRVYGPLTTPCPSCTVKAPAVTTGECPECGGKGEFHNERKEPFYAGFNAALLTPSPGEKEKP